MRALFVLALAALVTGCSLTDSKEDPVQTKLSDLDARLSRIERVVSNQSLLELAQHVDALQSELRGMRGQLDELTNNSESLRKQQRDLYTDLEKRLGTLEHGGTAGPADAASAGGASAPGAAGTAGAGTQSAEQAAYNEALELLKGAKYPEAIASFRKYLASWPSGELADNAEYWLGEAYYVTRDYEKAVSAFRAVGEQWPNSRKAPDALLKLGYSQFELKRYDNAQFTLTEVTHRFPGTDAAKLAAERLKQLPAKTH